MTTGSELTGMASAVERIVEGSPVIVAMMLVIGGVGWRAWREDMARARLERQELLSELREERQARAVAHKEMIQVMERTAARSDETLAKATEGLYAVQAALSELRHAIREQR
jgi:predicted nucleic acid-binding protein